MDEPMKQVVTALKPFFNEINARFDAVNARFDAKFDGVNAELVKVNQRLGGLEKDSADNKAAIRRVAVEVSKLKENMAEVQETMAPKDAMTFMFKRLTDNIDGFLPVIETARNERKNSDRSFDHLRSRLDAHDRRLTRLENKTA